MSESQNIPLHLFLVVFLDFASLKLNRFPFLPRTGAGGAEVENLPRPITAPSQGGKEDQNTVNAIFHVGFSSYFS